MDEKKSYYAIIPANVRYDADLTPNAKLLYGEITALCNEKGYCWAKNKYFAELYSTSEKSITRWIKNLADKGYIETDVKVNGYVEFADNITLRILFNEQESILDNYDVYDEITIVGVIKNMWKTHVFYKKRFKNVFVF